jgi:hypothetical protein
LIFIDVVNCMVFSSQPVESSISLGSRQRREPVPGFEINSTPDRDSSRKQKVKGTIFARPFGFGRRLFPEFALKQPRAPEDTPALVEGRSPYRRMCHSADVGEGQQQRQHRKYRRIELQHSCSLLCPEPLLSIQYVKAPGESPRAYEAARARPEDQSRSLPRQC